MSSDREPTSVPKLVIGHISQFDTRVSSMLSRVGVNPYISEISPENRYQVIFENLLNSLEKEVNTGEYDKFRYIYGGRFPEISITSFQTFINDVRDGGVTYFEEDYSEINDRFFTLLLRKCIESNPETVKLVIKDYLSGPMSSHDDYPSLYSHSTFIETLLEEIYTKYNKSFDEMNSFVSFKSYIERLMPSDDMEIHTCLSMIIVILRFLRVNSEIRGYYMGDKIRDGNHCPSKFIGMFMIILTLISKYGSEDSRLNDLFFFGDDGHHYVGYFLSDLMEAYKLLKDVHYED
jgi:hypothetical protein